MEHQTARELTAAYALDALDERDEQALEAHLATCGSCRAELDAFREAAAALSVLADAPDPPAHLRERLLERARAERSNVVPLVRRRNRFVVATAATAVAAVLAAVAVGVYAVSLSRSLDREREAAAPLKDPGARSIPVEGGRGRLVVAPDGRATLVVANLERAPAGRTYEVWIVTGGEAKPAGLFESEDDRDIVRVEGTVRPGDVVAVTVERDGGVAAPTGPTILNAPV